MLRVRHLLKSGPRAAFRSAFAFGLIVPALAQSATTSHTGPTAKSPSYEVASVKRSEPGCLGMAVSLPPGRFIARCITLWGLIYNAYDIDGGGEYAPGLPNWADSTTYDVDAKMDDDTAEAMKELSREEQGKQRRVMLQSLLADRFNLRVHYETRIQPIYSLVIAKGGPKLKQWPPSEKPRGMSWGQSQIKIQGWPVERLAWCLSSMAGRRVVDKTGLTGNFDISLQWTPDDQQGTPDAGPTLFTALQEQLGLKLISARGPAQTFVVDGVEQASQN